MAFGAGTFVRTDDIYLRWERGHDRVALLVFHVLQHRRYNFVATYVYVPMYLVYKSSCDQTQDKQYIFIGPSRRAHALPFGSASQRKGRPQPGLH